MKWHAEAVQTNGINKLLSPPNCNHPNDFIVEYVFISHKQLEKLLPKYTSGDLQPAVQVRCSHLEITPALVYVKDILQNWLCCVCTYPAKYRNILIEHTGTKHQVYI